MIFTLYHMNMNYDSFCVYYTAKSAHIRNKTVHTFTEKSK